MRGLSSTVVSPDPLRVALFGPPESPQINAAARAFAESGMTTRRCDMRLGGKVAPPAFTMGAGRAQWGDVDFADIDAVYVRGSAPNTWPVSPPMVNAASHAQYRADFIREQAYQAAAHAFLHHLRALGKLVINPFHVGYIDHDAKAQFYLRLAAEGFAVPETVATDDPEAALIFCRDHESVVAKPAIGVGSTRLVDAEDLARIQEAALAPVLLQERVRGDTIRVHVVGDRMVLALRIITDGGVDSRTATKCFEPFEMSEEQQGRIVRANRFLGLHFAAWDLIAAPDGRLVYLDCNPGPFLMWIGPENVQRVFQAMAGYMAETLAM